MLDDIVNSNFYLLAPTLIHLFHNEYFIVGCYLTLFLMKLFKIKQIVNDILTIIIGCILFISTLWLHRDFTWWGATIFITYLMIEWSFYIDHLDPKFRKDQDNKWWGVVWIFMIINASIKMRPYKIHPISFIKGLFWGTAITMSRSYITKIKNFGIEHLHLTPFKKDIKKETRA